MSFSTAQHVTLSETSVASLSRREHVSHGDSDDQCRDSYVIATSRSRDKKHELDREQGYQGKHRVRKTSSYQAALKREEVSQHWDCG